MIVASRTGVTERAGSGFKRHSVERSDMENYGNDSIVALCVLRFLLMELGSGGPMLACLFVQNPFPRHIFPTLLLHLVNKKRSPELPKDLRRISNAF